MTLEHFSEKDIPILRKYIFGDASSDEIKNTIKEWVTLEYRGKYFEMFAVETDDAVVGLVSIYQLSKTVVSLGIEIFSEFQRKGYALRAMKQAMEIAKSKGFTTVIDQVNTENAASIALHEKAGFERIEYEYTNKKGNSVHLFVMPLV